MKTLYLVRHAKSSWENPEHTDFERPLNDRGIKAAPKMAQYLINKGIKPQHFVSSPAARAITTARLFAQKFDFPLNNIQQIDKIYNSDKTELMEVISGLDDKYDSIMLFGHDTSITVTTEELSNQRFLHFPTGAAAGIKLNISKWADVHDGCGELQFFYFPKGIAEEQKAAKKALKAKQ
ncbi:MAG: histidine phosphatase family protein [Sphingobacteriales bacterium JAD_PAG50586_3]|nr:MAG: histidine phosphatase family protein [Sphingobacteriales bacterium JAD_PAG50586_3]